MEKKISTNQASLLLVIFTIALKLSVLPAIMNDFASTSSYISCLIALIIDFACTLIVIIIITKIPQYSFYDLVSNAMNKWVAKLAYILLFVYFFVKMSIALTEIHDYYTSSLFEELNPYFAIIVLFFLLLFMLQKNFQTLGRLLEVLFWPMAIGIGFTLIFPFSDIEISNLLPIFEDGMYPVWNAVYRTSLAFGDFMLLFILMGKISYKKNSRKKLILYVYNAMSFIFNFYVVFVGAFGDTTINQTLALGELPLHNPHPATINRLEWLTVIIWTALMFINAGILGKCCCDCIKNIFGLSDNKIQSFVISILATVIQVFAMFRVNIIAKIGTNRVAAPISIGFYIVMLTILIICYFRLKKPKGITNIESQIEQSRTNIRRAKECSDYSKS
ncbi:MAG: hypothetical protein E7354_04055 [Clostridiales bacterium]|nr:hypothetical protein [Clostridiales bacterium]